MTRTTEQLNELIEIARDGEKFYRKAAEKVGHSETRAIFEEQARVRDQFIQDLGQYVTADGETPSDDTTLLGAARQLYTDLRAKLSDDSEAVYISQLEEMEDRLLEHYEQAMEDSGTEIRRLLQSHLPLVQAAHERMRALKSQRA
jgi:uncharacterized protein (TIGR02284 family)